MRTELHYDGHGINGPDEYRTRIATFRNQNDADKYGSLLASAPDMLAALEWALQNAEWSNDTATGTDPIREAIAKARGQK
jgi:hypothetical protein